MDGEGCFAIKKTQHGYQFEFQIELHIDDLAVLNFLQTLRAPLSPLPLLVRGRG
jgi:LAGLIDADG DNA endonuclease family protein